MLYSATIFLVLSHIYGIWIYYVGKKHNKKIKKRTKSKKKSKTKNKDGSLAWFFVLYIVMIVIYLSIAGYVPNDDPMNPQNWIGFIGVYISYFFLKYFGYASYLVFLLIVELLVHNRLSTPRKRFLFIIPLIIGILFFTGFYAKGGEFGQLTYSFLLKYTGKIGSIFFSSLMLFISGLLLLEEEFYLPVGKGIIKFLSFVFKPLLGIMRIPKISLPSFRIKRKKKEEGIAEDTNDEYEDEEETEETEESDVYEEEDKEEEGEEDEDDTVTDIDKEEVKEEEKEVEEEIIKDVNIPDVDEEFQSELIEKLKDPEETSIKDKKFVQRIKEQLEKTLKEFSIDGYVENVVTGPVVTRIEFRPASGVRLSKIVNLVDNIALSLEASPVRIEAPIPGKALVGIEIPNEKRRSVFLKELLLEKKLKDIKGEPLLIGMGKDIDNRTVFVNISDMPHVIIAGTTGSGKSVCMNAIISTIIYRNSPARVRMIMIDPKRVEMSAFNRIPHLMVPVIHDPESAANALSSAVKWMEERYNRLRVAGVKDIKSFNRKMAKKGETMPYILIIIDELADLMMSSPKETESAIIRLAQMARAVGIHLVLATQRPSADVITGLIRSNIPARVAFRVSSKIDSRIIIDTNGAETLLGKGDMLILTPDYQGIRRAQGAFISGDETRYMANLWAKRYLYNLWEDMPGFEEHERITFINEFVDRDIIDAVLWKEEFAENSIRNLLDEMGIEKENQDEIVEYVKKSEYYPYIEEEIEEEKSDAVSSHGGFPYTEEDKRLLKKKYFVPFVKLARDEGYISARMVKWIGGREDDASFWIKKMQQWGWISKEKERKGPNLHRYKWLSHPDAEEFLNRIEGKE